MLNLAVQISVPIQRLEVELSARKGPQGCMDVLSGGGGGCCGPKAWGTAPTVL